MTAGQTRPGQLRRLLGTRELTVYYVSSLLGIGILVVPGIALDIAGPASLVAWLALAVATLPIAVAFARFSASYPSAGGVSHLIGTAFGRPAGTSIGLYLVLLHLTNQPILGLAAARYLAVLFGWTDRGVILTAAFVVMSFAVVLNMLGILVASRTQAVLVAVLLVGLLGAVALSVPAADPDRLTPFAPHGWTAIGAAAVVAFFSFFGWENAAHVADEVRDPGRSYPRAALIAAAVLGATYCTVALVIVLVVPAGSDNTAALSAVLLHSRGPELAKAGAALAAVLLVVTTNAWVCGASRLFYAMAREGVIPRRLAAVSGRNGAPVVALGVLWVAYAVDLSVLYVIGGDESNLVKFISAAILLIYVGTFVAGLRLFVDRTTRVLCAVALVAVSAFLLGAGWSALLAMGSYGLALGYVLLRRQAGAAGPG